MKKQEQQEIISAIKRASMEIFDIESKVFDKVEYKINHILEWARTPKDKRKPANIEWTASPERQVGYLIERLEYEIRKLKEKN